MFEKDCYHCSHIRPRKGNLCSILLKKVNDIHTFCCENFNRDLFVMREEESLLEKKEDEGSSYSYGRLILNFI